MTSCEAYQATDTTSSRDNLKFSSGTFVFTVHFTLILSLLSNFHLFCTNFLSTKCCFDFLSSSVFVPILNIFS